MITYLSKNILVNSGFEFVEHKKVNNNQYDYIYNFIQTDLLNNIDYKEANYKFNKLFEFFKHDIKEIHEQTGTNYIFKIVEDKYIISMVYD